MSNSANMAPRNTATFVFTDIEGSTQMLQRWPEDFTVLLEKHNELIRTAFAAHQGIEVDNTGDGFFFVFEDPMAALLATTSAQQALSIHSWKPGQEVKVRMGVHTGVAQLRDGTYIGLDVHITARIMAAAYGGQILLSHVVASALDGVEFDEFSVFAIGEFILKDLPQKEVLYQVLLEGASTILPERKERHTGRKTNIPSRPTPLIGRQNDIEEILSQIQRRDVRLITLAGPGGIGKTSLAVEVAQKLIHEYEDGAYMVFLAPVLDAQFVPSAIAQVLGFFLHTGIPVVDQLKEFIDGKRILLILDNFEHLLPAAQILVPILERCTNLKILVTSRSVLKLQWEWEYPVPPLPPASRAHVNGGSPEVGLAPSVELFIQRARAIDPRFTPVEKDIKVIGEICDKLDGLPLAIELAAVRIKVLSPKAILSRLCKRLDLLRSDRNDLPERHQTLRHAVGWSYDLLRKNERALFRQLGVYAGGFSLDTAEAVHARVADGRVESLEVITALRDQSLIRVLDSKTQEPRYAILETIREYALEQLMLENELEDAHKTHAVWFVTRAEDASRHFTGSDAREWLDRIEVDLDNYRAALKWSAESGDVVTGLRLCTALWRFWVIRAFLQEGVSHLSTQLANVTDHVPDVLRAGALNALGTLLHEISDNRAAIEVLTEAVRIFRRSTDKTMLATALNNLGWVSAQLGNLEEGGHYSMEAFELHKSTGNKRGMGVSMNNMAMISFCRSQYPLMREYYQKHYTYMNDIGDIRGIAYSLLCQTWGEQDSGLIHQMQSSIERATGMIGEVDDRQLNAWASTLQALLFFHTRRFENAKQLLHDNVEKATLQHNRLIVNLELILFGASDLKLGNLEEAKSYLNESLEYARARENQIFIGMSSRYLAEIYLMTGEYPLALEYVRESFQVRSSIHNTVGIADCGELLGRILMKQIRHRDAVILLASAAAFRGTLGVPLLESHRPEVENCITQLREMLGEEQFDEAWQTGARRNLAGILEGHLDIAVHS